MAVSRLTELLARRKAALFRWSHFLVPLAVLALVAGLRVSGAGWVELTQMRSFDAFMRRRPRPYEPAPVRIVDLDDDSLKRLGQWPLPRSVLARLVDRLRADGAAAVAFDAVFPEPDRLGAREDRAFARSIAAAQVVLGVPLTTARANAERPLVKTSFASRGEPAAFALRATGATPNLPAFEKAASGVGAITTAFERDGIVRRVPALWSLEGQLVPALWAEALRVGGYHGSYAVHSSMSDSRGRQRTGIDKINIGGATSVILNTDERGRVWLYPTVETAERVIPAWQVLAPGFDRARVEGCLVFVGTSAEGLKDLRATAVDPTAAGVSVHANIAEQVILGRTLSRPDWADGFELLYMLLLGLVLIVVLPRFGAAVCLPLAAAGVAGAVGGAWWAFTRKGFLLDPVFPSVTVLVTYFSSSIVSYLKTESERRQVKTAFSRYMAPALVEQLAKHPERLKLGGETREMTFHFCDIRGFTTISEQFDPHGLTQFINRFLTPMTDIVLQHQGVIDKYMGDCIMAFWNAPLDDADHARHACQAALAMHSKLYDLNKQWEAEAVAAGRKYLPIHIGTGLNTGRCVVGNMGSDQRFDYSVLGDDVNLASRLEGQSKTYGVDVVIGPRTREQAPEFATLELDLIKVKGKTVPVRIFALMGGPELANNASFKIHKVLHERMLAAYRAQRWDDARGLLEECRKLPLPLEKLYDLYERRLDVYVSQPPPADWDGAFTATSK